MTENKPSPPRNSVRPSMKRRCWNHDYRSRAMYMVTLAIEGRRQLLGRLAGDPLLPNGTVGAAHLVPSPLGEAVMEEWRAIPAGCPQVRNMQLQLMPDHLHFIVFVTSRMEKPLGSVVAAFKARCRQRYMQLIDKALTPPVPTYIVEEQALAQCDGRPSRYGLLFEHGLNDKLLYREGELQAWMDYLADNPRRRLLKERRPDLFRVKHNIKAGGFTFEAMGNELLLTHPRRLFVQCSRRLTDADIAALQEKAERDYADASVFVSPSVSPGERAIMHTAFERGCPVVVLRENGFGQYEKPGGRAFDACANGRMLLLAPWNHHTGNRNITRGQCLALNGMGLSLSTDKL